MKVVVPYTHTPLFTACPGYTVEQWDVSGDDNAYWGLLDHLWQAREPFIVVEHDVFPGREALDDLVACGNGWCCQPYPYWRGMQHGLACCKFGLQVIDAVPDLWQVVARMYDATHPRQHWCRLDAWSNRVLTQAGRVRCNHRVPVAHTHVTPSHGCI